MITKTLHPNSFVLRAVFVLALALLTAGAAVAAPETDTVSRSFELRSGSAVEVFNVNGEVRVESWTGSELKIEATKKAQSKNPEQAREILATIEIVFEEKDNGLTVRVELPDTGWSNWLRGKRRARVDFDLLVPEGLDTLIRSDNGSITLEATTGKVDARTTNGRIRIIDAVGQIRARTTNGWIRAGLAKVTAPVELTTTSGRIDLYVAPGVSASLDARTTNGSIEMGDEVRVSSINDQKTSLRGQFGMSGAKITLRAVNGVIALGSRALR